MCRPAVARLMAELITHQFVKWSECDIVDLMARLLCMLCLSVDRTSRSRSPQQLQHATGMVDGLVAELESSTSETYSDATCSKQFCATKSPSHSLREEIDYRRESSEFFQTSSA